jgi:hypothetical protein
MSRVQQTRLQSSPNLQFKIRYMVLVQHIEAIILPEKFSPNKAEEENVKKIRTCKKISYFRSAESGNLVQIFDSG